MRKLPRLYVVMLRYRVAAMIALFLLLGAAREGPLDLGLPYLLAVLALASSYVAATALNDLADEDIDKVNHPRDAGRPLVEGTADRRELLVLHVVASVAALAAAAALDRRAVLLVAVSLLLSQIYSARPVRLSYRVAGAPLALGIAYVAVPYALGIVAAGGTLRHAWSRLAVALFLLFCARILLKDFRDREGDAQFGKPTILLRFGKDATCVLSLCALVAGDAVLALALPPALALVVQPLVLAIAWMLRELRRAGDGRAEQVAIGIGARTGNGLLLCVLAALLVRANGASGLEAALVAGGVAAVFGLSFLSLASHPETVTIGYKG
jgi:1,4-dihydroxy-2-naphthoate polyprenyltransferase